jgi:hypothetical protein
MTPIIAIEVAPAESTDARSLSALLRACSLALPVGSCESASDGEPASPLWATARVTWDDTGNAVVTVRLASEQRELSRDLRFVPEDPPLQRWRTVGLTIATIVDELEVRREAETAAMSVPAPEEASPPSSVPAPPAHDAPAQTPTMHAEDKPFVSASKPQPTGSYPSSTAAEVGGVAGTGLARGVRGGIYARATRDVAGVPALARLRVAYLLSSSEQPSVTWSELELGGGVYLRLARLRIELDAGVGVVRTTASARSPTSATIDEASSWLPGASLNLHAVWPANASVAGLLGVRGAWLARAVAVSNAGREIARVPAYSVVGVGGVRFAF